MESEPPRVGWLVCEGAGKEEEEGEKERDENGGVAP